MLSRNLFREISILKLLLSRNLNSQTCVLEKFISRNLNSQKKFLEKSNSREKKNFEKSQFSNFWFREFSFLKLELSRLISREFFLRINSSIKKASFYSFFIKLTKNLVRFIYKRQNQPFLNMTYDEGFKKILNRMTPPFVPMVKTIYLLHISNCVCIYLEFKRGAFS